MKVNYADLKSALIPRSEKNEIAFIFDRFKMDSWYGYEVFSKLIPLQDKQSSNSVLFGDFIGADSLRDKLKAAFFENIVKAREFDYQYHNQFCIVYINNLPNEHVKTINEGLSKFIPYVGFFDLTYSSFLKTYLATILSRHYLKNKSTIIAANEFNENTNVYGYPFERYGYRCVGIDTVLYGLFLSYKIEREVFKSLENDTSFSINAITSNVSNIFDFNLKIEEPKLEYLLREKLGSMERTGMTKLTLAEIEKLIKSKISNNYIYNLCFLEKSQTLKFNIIIETTRIDVNKPMKITVALEYKPTDKILRLITMY